MGGKPRQSPIRPRNAKSFLEELAQLPPHEADELATSYVATAAIGDYMSKRYGMDEKEGNAFGVQILLLLKQKGFTVIRDRRKD